MRKLFYAFLCLLFFIAVNYASYAQAWQSIGADDLVQPSYGEAGDPRVVISSAGMPYIAYADASRASKLTVMQYDGMNWVAVGSPGFSSGAALYINLAFDLSGALYIAYSDLGLAGKGVVKKFNGTSWTNVGGATFSTGQVQYVSLAINSAGTPYVAIQDMTSANHNAYVKSFNGTSWVSVGSSAATSGEATNLSLAFDASGTPNLAYRIEGVGPSVGKAAVVKLSGSSWINVGTPAFSPGTVDYLSLAADAAGVLHLAYRDEGNAYRASVKKFVSGAWTDVGLPGFSPGQANFTSLCFDAASVPYVVFSDGANLGNATVMKFISGAWGYVGTAGFSDGNTMSTSIALATGGVPFTVYSDYSKRGKAVVKKYDSGVWTEVGPAATIANNAKATAVSADGAGNLYLAYADELNGSKANVTKYSSGSWTTVGQTAFSAGEANYLSLAVNQSGTPYVAYQDWVNGAKATVKQFDGSSWVNVGAAGFTVNAVSFTSIAFDPSGIPFLAFRDQANSNKATVKKFVGGSWIDVGAPGFSSGGAWSTSLAIDASGVPYIVYSDLAVSSKAVVRKFDGSSWVDVGTPGVSANSVDFTALALSPTGMPYVVYSTGGTGVNVKRFDGVNWVNVGTASFITGAEEIALTISAAGIPYISYREVANGKKLSVRKFDGTSWVAVGSTGLSGGEVVGTDITAYNNNIYVSYAAGKKVTNGFPPIIGWGAYVKVYTEPAIFSAAVATPTNVVCAGSPVTFTATVANGGVAPTYQWRVNSSAIPGATNTTFTSSTLATGSSVDCIVTSSDPGNPTITTNSIGMTVNNCAPVITALNPALNFCRGDAVTIDFTASGNYAAGNIFTAQLSNGAGSFASPVTIGTINATTGGTINATIPTAQAAGSGYRIRIVSSAPALTSADNGANLSIAILPTAAQALVTVAGSLSFCTGGSVDLSVPATAGLSYQWKNGGVPVAGATGTNYTATVSGSYTVEVTNASGCSRTSAIKTVVVNTPPAATVTPSQHQATCAGQPVTFQANTGAGLSYQWLLNGSNVAGATGSSYIANAAGVYSVAVTNAGGCLAISDTIGLIYYACGATITSINPSPNICRGDGVSVSYSAPGTFNAGNVFTAQLSNAAGSFATPVTIGTLTSTTSGMINATIPTGQAAGSGYRIRIVSSSPAFTGSDNSTNLSILIQPTAAQATIAVNGSLAICPGETVGLSVPSVAGLSYQWRLAGNIIPGATSNSYIASLAGAYSVMVSNANGCSRTSANKTVTMLASPTASITPSAEQSLCATGSVAFTANAGTGLSYIWLMNGSGIPGATNSAYSATATGNYSVQVTNSNGCFAVSPEVSVTADCGAVIIDTGVRKVCAGGGLAVSFTATGFDGSNQFTLQLSDNAGSFNTPVDIGMLASSSGGSISGMVPGGTPEGSDYKLRIVSSDPVSTGDASPLTINIQSTITGPVDLCAVTVDSATGKNMLIWNKLMSASIDSFVFYRNTAGVFERIGVQSYGQFSTWIDSSSEPSTLQHGYYITGKNSCGETVPSTSHLTMHLAISQGQSATIWNLSWNGYEGFPHMAYQIWRGTSPTNMAVLRDISARDYNSFTDFNAPAGTVYYMVSVADAPSCNPTARTTTEGMKIRSNIASNINGMTVAIWPNPATANAELLVQSKTVNEIYKVRMMDILGRSVEQFEVLSNKEASFGQLAAPGVYTIEVTDSKGGRLVSRWAKQ